jgi:hypothetical protein
MKVHRDILKKLDLLVDYNGERNGLFNTFAEGFITSGEYIKAVKNLQERFKLKVSLLSKEN